MRADPLQTHEMLFDAHSHAFRVLGGVPRRGIYDNMRTAVDRAGIGKKRDVNTRFAAMGSHYLFDTDFCNPASGREKGQVEKNVQDARRRLWQAMPRFATLTELNDWLEQRCQASWRQIPHASQEEAVLCAVELALSDGAPTKTHVLNLLHRLIDGKSTSTGAIETPQALALNREPRADVERYDALRDKLQEARHAS